MADEKQADATYMVRKTYTRIIFGSENVPDDRCVRFDIETTKPLPIEFDVELMKLISKYTS